MRKSKTEKMVVTAMLAAIGYVLMFLAFPLIPAFSFMTADFSDLPILIGTFLFGPGVGTMISFVRSLLHYLTTGASLTSLIGDATSFVASIVYVMPIYFISKEGKEKKKMVPALFIGIVSLTITMSIANYFVVTPLYFKLLGFDIGMPMGKYILAGVVPFNIFKGVIISSVFALVYAKLLPWIEKKRNFITN